MTASWLLRAGIPSVQLMFPGLALPKFWGLKAVFRPSVLQGVVGPAPAQNAASSCLGSAKVLISGRWVGFFLAKSAGCSQEENGLLVTVKEIKQCIS